MVIFIVIISILAIAGVVAVWNRFGFVWICPICAGVSGTWLWMLIGVLSSQLQITDYQLPIAILMGGSVVGIAYQIEKLLPSNRLTLFWKIFFIPMGFVAVYSLVSFWWVTFVAAVSYLLLTASVFLHFLKPFSEKNRKTVKELEEKMKNCC